MEQRRAAYAHAYDTLEPEKRGCSGADKCIYLAGTIMAKLPPTALTSRTLYK
ncbi:hypothetical protein SAMN04488037_103313 [Shimia marina]|uniref:Uncharacterized protein n=1 Tax=Shimia marina TaxID=321267 RepID=A0A0P1FE25_9RHOB|nr:hypothetical protein SHM7688_02514 [Shimia marina]SFD93480.1 hypothetical protein SAMN04488037_103313 [Shimia marina]